MLNLKQKLLRNFGLIRSMFILLLFTVGSCELEDLKTQIVNPQVNAEDVRPLKQEIYLGVNTANATAKTYINNNTDWQFTVKYIKNAHIASSSNPAKADLTKVINWFNTSGLTSTSNNLLVLDWEGAPFNNLYSTDSSIYKPQVREYLKVIRKIRELAPSLKIGVYDLPFSSYFYDQQTYINQNLPADKFDPIFLESDVITPSLYMAYPETFKLSTDPSFNENFLSASLDRALLLGNRLNKPVVPFFWWRITTLDPKDPAHERGYFWDPATFGRFSNQILTHEKNGARVSGMIMWENEQSAPRVNSNSPGVTVPATGTSWVADPTTEEEWDSIIIQEVQALEAVRSNKACFPISTLPCSQIKKSIPLYLYFRESTPNSIVDKNGFGTGFTMVDAYTGTRLSADGKPSNLNARGYEQSKLELKMNATTSTLNITTNKGISAGTNNNQINALGMEVDSYKKFTIQTIIVNPYNGTQYQQGGLWFGVADNTFFKLIIIGNQIELRREVNNAAGTNAANQRITPVITGLNTKNVLLEMRVNPTTNTVEGFYSLDGGVTYINVGEGSTIKGLSTSNLGLTSSTAYAGIFATHRNGSTPVTYTFDSFNITPF